MARRRWIPQTLMDAAEGTDPQGTDPQMTQMTQNRQTTRDRANSIRESV